MSADNKDIEDLYNKLKQSVENENEDNILKNSICLLNKGITDDNVVKCACLCYINNNEFDKAMEILSKSENSLYFEKAYCFYRLDNLEESMKCLKKSNKDMKCLILESQILYKLKEYEKCIKVYEEIMSKKEITVELITNYISCFIMSGLYEEMEEKLGKLKYEKSYEILFNMSLCYYYENKIEESMKLIEEALKLGESELKKNELKDDEISRELCSLYIFKGHLLSLTGKPIESLNLLQSLIHSKSQSKVNTIIIQNNISSLVSSRSLKEAYQKLYGISEEIISKLSENQIGMIYLNRLLIKFEMLMNKKCSKSYENFGNNKEIANEEERMKLMKELSEEFEKMKEIVILSGESRYYYFCCLNYLYSYIDVSKIDETNLRMMSVKECEVDENNLLLESRRLNKNENKLNELEEAKEKSRLLLKKKKNLKKREKNRLKFIEKLKTSGKGDIENVKLDEDRWKPKYLRVSYQKSRKGMKMSNKGSSQGVNQNKNESDKFDMKKKVDERKSTETSKANTSKSSSSSTTTATSPSKSINQSIKKRQGKKKRR